MGIKSELIDITNETFGYWTVIKRDGKDKWGKTTWICQCECKGENSIRSLTRKELKFKMVKSCGCKPKESKYEIYPDMTISEEYRAWYSMRERCYNIRNQSFKDYGGRGITVCDRWLNSFVNFYDDMGDRPGREYSIERVNNNGNYEPNNCKWATKKEQARNSRNAKLSMMKANRIREFYWAGIKTKELADMFGVSKYTIYSIIKFETWN